MSAPWSGRRPLEAAERTRVTDLMNKDVVTVRADVSVDSLIELLLDRGLSRVPVVDETGQPVGMVAKTDLIVASHWSGDTEAERPAIPVSSNVRYTPEGFHVHPTGAVVRDVMTPMLVSLPETASVAEAAQLMATQHLHGVPVTSASGELVGLLSTSDIVGWVAGL